MWRQKSSPIQLYKALGPGWRTAGPRDPSLKQSKRNWFFIGLLLGKYIPYIYTCLYIILLYIIYIYIFIRMHISRKYIEIKQKMEWFGISRNCLCVSLIHTKFQPLLVMAFHKQWNQVPKMPMPNMSNNHLSRNWEKPVQRFWVVGFWYHHMYVYDVASIHWESLFFPYFLAFSQWLFDGSITYRVCVVKRPQANHCDA